MTEQTFEPDAFTDIGVTLHDHVATVEIQRPPHNFFDHSLICQIADAFDALDAEADCRAIILASTGKAFCAGANFGTGQEDGSGSDDFTEEGFQNTTGKLYQEATRLFRNRKPIIGAIQGAAIGGGLGLSLVPDFRVASPAARFGANFVKLGLHQGFGISVTLPRLIGQPRSEPTEEDQKDESGYCARHALTRAADRKDKAAEIVERALRIETYVRAFKPGIDLWRLTGKTISLCHGPIEIADLQQSFGARDDRLGRVADEIAGTPHGHQGRYAVDREADPCVVVSSGTSCCPAGQRGKRPLQADQRRNAGLRNPAQSLEWVD